MNIRASLIFCFIIVGCTEKSNIRPTKVNYDRIKCSESGYYKLINSDTIEYKSRVSRNKIVDGRKIIPTGEYYSIFERGDEHFNKALEWIEKREPDFLKKKEYVFTENYEC
jgi:hypothetical protein